MARAPKLTNATLEALTAELERRRSSIPKLEAKAAALREQLAEVEAEIDTLRDLHRQMCEIAAEHQGANGLIKDTEANAAFNQLNAQAEAVIQSFPRLG